MSRFAPRLERLEKHFGALDQPTTCEVWYVSRLIAAGSLIPADHPAAAIGLTIADILDRIEDSFEPPPPGAPPPKPSAFLAGMPSSKPARQRRVRRLIIAGKPARVVDLPK